MNELPLNLYCHRKCLIDLSKLYSHSNKNVFRSATSAKPPFQDINTLFLSRFLSFILVFEFWFNLFLFWHSRNVSILLTQPFLLSFLLIYLERNRNRHPKYWIQNAVNIQILKEILRNFSAHNKKQHTTKVLSEVPNSW